MIGSKGLARKVHLCVPATRNLESRRWDDHRQHSLVASILRCSFNFNQIYGEPPHGVAQIVIRVLLLSRLSANSIVVSGSASAAAGPRRVASSKRTRDGKGWQASCSVLTAKHHLGLSGRAPCRPLSGPSTVSCTISAFRDRALLRTSCFPLCSSKQLSSGNPSLVFCV